MIAADRLTLFDIMELCLAQVLLLDTFDVEFWSLFQYAINNTEVQSLLGCE